MIILQITIMGYACLIVALISLLLRNKYILLYASVFLSGFTGSSVATISGVSIQPSYFLFILFILFSLNKFYKFKVDKFYLFFLIYCIINSFFPILLARYNISLMLQNGQYGILTYSASNFIHIGYLIFTFVFFTYLCNNKKNIVKEKVFKAYKYGIFAFIFVTLYQVIAFKYNLAFDEIFRQSVHGNIQGTRLYGPCGEASMMAYYLAPSLLFLWMCKKNPFDLLMFVIGSVIGFTSYSSTFLVGYVLILVVILVSAIMRIRKPIRPIMFLSLMIVGLVTVIVISLNSDLITYAYDGFITKLNKENTSGIERSESFNYMINIGFDYPFGVGFGSSRSKDLLSTWACNIGIIGLVVFALATVHFYINSLKINNKYIYIYNNCYTNDGFCSRTIRFIYSSASILWGNKQCRENGIKENTSLEVFL